MNECDLDRLRKPYEKIDRYSEAQFADALGAVVGSSRLLSQEIFGDFDPQKRGVGWWAPHPGTKRRILISDYLYLCTKSIETNMVEAMLHLLESKHNDEQEAEFIFSQIRADRATGKPIFQLPPRKAPVDELAMRLGELHVIGFFRAIKSILDCLGAMAIGVLGLKSRIIRAELDSALGALSKEKNGSGPEGMFWSTAQDRIVALEKDAGPTGWRFWATDFRNMLVHRGRRMGIKTMRPKSPTILRPDGVPIMESPRLLPQDPGLSEIESILDQSTPICLTENGNATMRGVFESTHTFTEKTAEFLVDAWRERRTNPSLINQPKEQWPKIPSTRKSKFRGYDVGQIPFDMGAMVTNPETVYRLKVASMVAEDLHLWQEYD